MYFAIIGDIMNSKKMNMEPDMHIRNKVQSHLNKILEQVNKTYEGDIAANFLITLGDEFQGLLHCPKNIFEIIEYIKLNMYPVKLRFGIGIGDIYTDINRELALGADGPAFYHARQMIDQIKLLEKGKMTGSVNIMLYEDNRIHKQAISLINCTLQLCSFIESTWTQKQRDLIKKIILEKKNQVEAAEDLKITQSSVQRRLKAAGYYDYKNGIYTVTKLLDEIWGRYN